MYGREKKTVVHGAFQVNRHSPRHQLLRIIYAVSNCISWEVRRRGAEEGGWRDGGSECDVQAEKRKRKSFLGSIPRNGRLSPSKMAKRLTINFVDTLVSFLPGCVFFIF